MKGIIFTELLEMVEEQFGLATVNRVVAEAAPANEGGYTSVGTYDYQELVNLVVALSKITEISAGELQRLFGQRLFRQFSQHYAGFFVGVHNAFEFLERVDTYVHVEVHKLYPEAELPRFRSLRLGNNRLVLDYESGRPFADLAQGLIEGCISHYGVPIDLVRENLETGNRTRSRFVLEIVGAS